MGALCATARARYHNRKIAGKGGDLNPKSGRKVCIVFAFNYKAAPGYQPDKDMPLCELTSLTDGKRFAALARACGVETRAFYDAQVPGSMGWPGKDNMVNQLKTLGAELGEDDELVFFFGGHGMQSLAADSDGDEDDGHDEELCLVDPDGTYNPLKDDEIADILAEDFNPGTKVLFVTDCCQSGTVCDMSKPELQGREICHIAAVKDSQYAADWGDGGGFTICVLETIEEFVNNGQTEFSIVEIHNSAYDKFKKAYPDEADEVEFCFEQPLDLDPDTFQWSLVPPPGYKVKTLLDSM